MFCWGEVSPARPFSLIYQGLLGSPGGGVPPPPPPTFCSFYQTLLVRLGAGGGPPPPSPSRPPPLPKAFCKVSSCDCCFCVHCSMLGNFYCRVSTTLCSTAFLAMLLIGANDARLLELSACTPFAALTPNIILTSLCLLVPRHVNSLSLAFVRPALKSPCCTRVCRVDLTVS